MQNKFFRSHLVFRVSSDNVVLVNVEVANHSKVCVNFIRWPLAVSVVIPETKSVVLKLILIAYIISIDCLQVCNVLCEFSGITKYVARNQDLVFGRNLNETLSCEFKWKPDCWARITKRSDRIHFEIKFEEKIICIFFLATFLFLEIWKKKWEIEL